MDKNLSLAPVCHCTYLIFRGSQFLMSFNFCSDEQILHEKLSHLKKLWIQVLFVMKLMFLGFQHRILNLMLLLLCFSLTTLQNLRRRPNSIFNPFNFNAYISKRLAFYAVATAYFWHQKSSFCGEDCSRHFFFRNLGHQGSTTHLRLGN